MPEAITAPPAALSPITAKQQWGEMVDLLKSTVKDAQKKFLIERVSAFEKYGPVKAKIVLRRLASLRKARRDREFREYTTKPCGCYNDPGGHP